ncbi:pantoate--beta-alanine ligase [Gammaproteobacteria bacterium]|jgi:pantoate--beta-alanine ligase|nr:pantoate--beta-alanine ligase [Gammaproteobacteria bacterium]MDC3302127.1 pantoate--beta-alanine ligase [Gammaproteobacteria bacterium]
MKLKPRPFPLQSILFIKLKIVKNIKDFNDIRSAFDQITFIPTMGNLHNGHLSLFERASELNNPIFSSIFINPLQFNNKNDFANYPKTLKNDISLLESHNCECLFLPDESILDNIEQIKAPDKANFLCGANRPGHFDGVLTIVNKLFDIMRPSDAVFGLKDYQQYLLIKDYVNSRNLPINVVGSKTIRDKNGLAMSSRNNLLTSNELIKASEIYKSLLFIKNNTKNLSKHFLDEVSRDLNKKGFKVDYLTVINSITLQECLNQRMEEGRLIVAIAAKIGSVRLIDNIFI